MFLKGAHVHCKPRYTAVCDPGRVALLFVTVESCDFPP